MSIFNRVNQRIDQLDRKAGLHRDFYRRGPDYRHGDDVSFADIKSQFGFSGLRIGQWVTKEEKRLAANLVFDALADLAFLLNLPPEALGLRNSLNMAFGTGGNRHAQAHYAPGSRTLALAKNAGAGALAHEWWHAFDHHVADKLFPSEPTNRSGFASTRWLTTHKIHLHPLNQRLDTLFCSVLLTQDGNNEHAYVRRSISLDRQHSVRYFSIPSEMMARAFEAWVQSRTDIKNAYLVSGTKQSELARSGAYPDEQHLAQIDKAIRGYFGLLGEYLEKH